MLEITMFSAWCVKYDVADLDMFKVGNADTRTILKNCSKLQI